MHPGLDILLIVYQFLLLFRDPIIHILSALFYDLVHDFAIVEARLFYHLAEIGLFFQAFPCLGQFIVILLSPEKIICQCSKESHQIDHFHNYYDGQFDFHEHEEYA